MLRRLHARATPKHYTENYAKCADTPQRTLTLPPPTRGPASSRANTPSQLRTIYNGLFLGTVSCRTGLTPIYKEGTDHEKDVMGGAHQAAAQPPPPPGPQPPEHQSIPHVLQKKSIYNTRKTRWWKILVVDFFPVLRHQRSRQQQPEKYPVSLRAQEFFFVFLLKRTNMLHTKMAGFSPPHVSS